MAVRTRNQVIAFRVTLAEARKIREKVRRSGLSRTQAHPGGAVHLGKKPEPAHRPGPHWAHSDGVPYVHWFHCFISACGSRCGSEIFAHPTK